MTARSDKTRRPLGVTDETVEAVGKLTEAFERVERARGRLYDFHQLMGGADRMVGEAADLLAAAGHHQWAVTVRRELFGRNALDGRWTFQVVEDYNRSYYRPFQALEVMIRDELLDGQPHVYESEVKLQEQRQSAQDRSDTAAGPVSSRDWRGRRR